MSQLSFKEAKRLSIIKWKFIIDNNIFEEGELDSSMNGFPKEIFPLLHFCGFCERWKGKRPNYSDKDCDHCEFGNNTGKCNEDPNSLFTKYEGAMMDGYPIEARMYAERILESIENLQP